MTLIQSEVTANQQRTPGEREAGEQDEEGEAGMREPPPKPHPPGRGGLHSDSKLHFSVSEISKFLSEGERPAD